MKKLTQQQVEALPRSRRNRTRTSPSGRFADEIAAELKTCAPGEGVQVSDSELSERKAEWASVRTALSKLFGSTISSRRVGDTYVIVRIGENKSAGGNNRSLQTEMEITGRTFPHHLGG